MFKTPLARVLRFNLSFSLPFYHRSAPAVPARGTLDCGTACARIEGCRARLNLCRILPIRETEERTSGRKDATMFRTPAHPVSFGTTTHDRTCFREECAAHRGRLPDPGGDADGAGVGRLPRGLRLQ